MTRWRRHLGALAIWTVVWALFFALFLAGARHFSGGDFSGQFHAFGLFQAQEMSAGRLPVWSPGSYGGFPFAGDTQAAVFYLPRWVTIFLSSPWGFPYYALELEALAHIWLLGVFTYALAYALTQRRLAALLGAIAFALGGYTASYPISQLAVLETITWLPLLLLLLRRGVARANLKWLLGAGLVWALAACAGHPQTLLHITYLAGAYYLFLAIKARRRWTQIVGWGVFIALVALGTAAPAWLPALRYMVYTTRSGVGYDFVAQGLPLLDFTHLWVPGVWGTLAPTHIGLATLALALVAWWGRRRAQTAEIVFWSVVALLAAWLSLGDEGVLFQAVYYIAPGFSLFRRQERLLSLFGFSGALLAAQGAALWLAIEADVWRRWRYRLLGILGGGFLALAGLFAIAAGVTFQPWPGLWARYGAIAGLVLVLLWGLRWRRARLYALIVLLSVNLYLVAWGAIEHQPGAPDRYWPQPEWLTEIESDEPARIDSGNLVFANLGQIYGLEDIAGLSPLKPQALEDLSQLSRARRWQLLNVTHVLAEQPPENVPLTQVATITEDPRTSAPLQAGVYRFADALPRAWLSDEPLLVDGPQAAFDTLAGDDFDPATQVVLQAPCAGSETVIAGTLPLTASAQTTRLNPAALEIDVNTAVPAVLVISEWDYPGWQATLDGARVPICRANHAFQAVVVPAGQHQVRLRFVPWDVWAGIGCAVVTLLAGGVVAWRWGARGVSSPSKKHPPDMAFEPGKRGQAPSSPPGMMFERNERSECSREPLSLIRLPWPWLLVAIILLGFALRAFGLGVQELRGDEAFSYVFAYRPLGEVIPTLLAQGDPHPPLHYLLLNLWMQVTGTGEYAMRYLSLLAGVLALPLAYQVGRMVRDKRLGLFCAALLATSESLVWVAQDVRNQYTFTILFTLLATWLLVRAARRPHWLTWLGYAAACLPAVYTHYYSVFALLAHGLYLLCQPRRGRLILAWSLCGLFSIAALTPWLGAIWPRLMAQQLQDPTRPYLAPYLTTIGRELSTGAALGRTAGRWVFLCVLGLVIVGLRRLWKTQRAWAALLVGWIGGAALGIFLILFRRATFNAFYISVAAPAWWLAGAVGLLALWELRHRWARLLAALGLGVIIVSTGISLGRHDSGPATSRTNGARGVAAHIAGQVAPGDVFVANFPDPVWDYYLAGVPLDRVMQPATPRATPEETIAALEALAEDDDRLWFVPYHNDQWDRDGVVGQWLETHMLTEQRATYVNMTLSGYRPPHAWAQVMAPVDVSLGEQLRLESAFMMVDGRPVDLSQPVDLSPGVEVEVALLWQAEREIESGYTVFVHVLDAQGQVVAQHDGWPVEGAYPTFLWAAGEQVLDTHTVTVPADGALDGGALVVGAYHSESQVRLTTGDGQDAVDLVEISSD